MGQEASLPTDPDFEEQAKAPPSSSNPPTHMAAQRSGRKMIGAFLRNQNNPQNDESFEQREAARAAALGGNLYNDDGSSSSSYQTSGRGDSGVAYGDEHRNALQQQNLYYGSANSLNPQHSYVNGQTNDAYNNNYQQSGSTLPQHYPPADGLSDQPVVSVMYERTGSKRGIFPARASARGAALIHSMRNLSLGGALRPGKNPKEVNDWEKQWDADEDDSEGEEEQRIMPLHQVKPPLSPPRIAPQQYQGSLEPPQTFAAMPGAQQVVPPPYPQVTPEKPDPFAVAPQEDLLSRPNVGDDGLEWDTGLEVIPSEEMAKPNVQMFMPMLRVLGKGSFGKVVLVQKRLGKERGQLFAMKILRKTHLVKRRQIERTRTERKVLSVVNHPFIMKLHYAFQTPDKLYLVLDYCPGGELFFHLSRFRRFPERVARFFSAELLLAIGHLHKRGIIYRDLKPENVLLDAEGHVKLGDFGLAKAGIKHPCEGATSMCGTPEYMAPEVLGQMGHGFCVDYWGLGMLTYEMMTGLPPWYTTDRAKLFRRLKSAPLDIPSYFSVQSASCVTALLERDPRRRLGFAGIRHAMEHDFFRCISWRSLYARRVEPPIRPCEGWKAPEAIDDEDPAFTTQNGKNSGVEHLNSNYLEAATANFDNTFTRMPVESDDPGHDAISEEGDLEELNENTFVGFSFDCKDRDAAAALAASANSPVRARTQHYNQETSID